MAMARWKKVLADLWSNKVRTLLAALSIAVGVFAVGVVANGYFILSHDVDADYQSANPHQALIFTTYFDDDLLIALRRTPGVAAAEGQSQISLRMGLPGGPTYTTQITSIPPLDEIEIDKIKLERGAPVLGKKEIYLDRTALAVLPVDVGDTLLLTLGESGTAREVRVAGIVHAIRANSYAFSNTVYGYVSPDTMEWLGGSREYNAVLLTVTENQRNEAHVRAVADQVSDKIERSGREVFVTIVQNPGQHPVQSMLDATLGLMSGMGMLSVFLSGFLVTNTIAALMAQQTRQIGVMKAVGATSGQLMGMYLVLVLGFGMIALLLGVPLAAGAGYLLSGFVAALLNVNLAGFRIPMPSLIAQVVVGLLVPALGALFPVLSGTRLTVREALSSYGIGKGNRSLFDRMIELLRGLPRPLLLSLRNTFRRKARLLLTLSTLTLGGAIFIGVLNVQSAMYVEIDKTLGYFLSDMNLDFNRYYRMERVRASLEGIQGIQYLEGWGMSTGQVMQAGGQTGTEIMLIAPPANSSLITPTLTAGRWLLPGDENALVICNHFQKARPEVQVGDTVQLRLENREYPFVVVGVCQMAGTVIPPFTYANYEYISQLRNEIGQVASIRMHLQDPTPAEQARVAAELKERFKSLGMEAVIQTGVEIQAQQRTAINIIISLLLFMAVLIAVVGGLGLMGTMSMNVLERTREIGVMRSIGAVNGAIFQLVIVEGVLIGWISWALGALLSVPITMLLNGLVGVAFLNLPMPFILNPQGLVLWLVIVTILASLASFFPARTAVRLTVRDVLAYE